MKRYSGFRDGWIQELKWCHGAQHRSLCWLHCHIGTSFMMARRQQQFQTYRLLGSSSAGYGDQQSWIGFCSHSWKDHWGQGMQCFYWPGWASHAHPADGDRVRSTPALSMKREWGKVPPPPQKKIKHHYQKKAKWIQGGPRIKCPLGRCEGTVLGNRRPNDLSLSKKHQG